MTPEFLILATSQMTVNCFAKEYQAYNGEEGGKNITSFSFQLNDFLPYRSSEW